MYYEEAIIDGRLMSRTAPVDDWELEESKRGIVVNAFMQLNEQDQEQVLRVINRSMSPNAEAQGRLARDSG